MEKTDQRVSIQRKWLRLGLLVALLHYVFLVLVIFLLKFDLLLAAVVATGVSIGGAVALILYVSYRY